MVDQGKEGSRRLGLNIPRIQRPDSRRPASASKNEGVLTVLTDAISSPQRCDDFSSLIMIQTHGGKSEEKCDGYLYSVWIGQEGNSNQ